MESANESLAETVGIFGDVVNEAGAEKPDETDKVKIPGAVYVGGTRETCVFDGAKSLIARVTLTCFRERSCRVEHIRVLGIISFCNPTIQCGDLPPHPDRPTLEFWYHLERFRGTCCMSNTINGKMVKYSLSY